MRAFCHTCIENLLKRPGLFTASFHCGQVPIFKNTLQGSHFGLGVTNARLLSVVLSNSSFVTTSCSFSLWSLIFWYCHSCLLTKQCKLSLSLSLRYPSVLCLAKKRGTSKINLCIFLVTVSFRKYIVNLPNFMHKTWQFLFQLLSKNLLAKMNLSCFE